jgi:hypothetical protein
MVNYFLVVKIAMVIFVLEVKTANVNYISEVHIARVIFCLLKPNRNDLIFS